MSNKYQSLSLEEFNKSENHDINPFSIEDNDNGDTLHSINDIDGGSIVNSQLNNNKDNVNGVDETTNLIQSEEVEYIEEDGEVELQDFADMIMMILKPVTITIIIVVWAVRILFSTFSNYTNVTTIYTLAYDETASDSTGSKFLGAMLNSLIFLGVIVLTTVLFVVLYKYRCLKIIFGWLFCSVGLLLGSVGGYIFYNMLQIENLALDYISFFFILYNIVVGGIVSIFWYSPEILNQAYLVLISALMAISFTRLPEWTVFAILAVVAVYDLFAVLCPRGPLKVLVETAQERKEKIPALVYDSDRDKGGVKLGLGDFVFYSVLIARAALFDISTVFTCYVAIITGLFATLLLLAIAKKALPALPISIALGILFYYCSSVFLYPFIQTLGSAQIFI
ncbi:presenilin family protein [Tieghemostelium lacteum]|uniref:Presenilin n=1 Tax=Tieghemostelium lacteum TaxID=361077 RepID=A0A152A8N0_TIELA|nr:presenilin family protein [Tieghemostelium lacteum]|eukprot:KYR02475.1 presenilin family protein [Tieghemostelium lacteum]